MGQDKVREYHGLAFPAVGVSADSSTAENENGRYILAPVDAQSFEIQAHPSSCEGYTPGTLADGVLTPGANCTSAADQIVATVTPNNFTIQ